MIEAPLNASITLVYQYDHHKDEAIALHRFIRVLPPLGRIGLCRLGSSMLVFQYDHAGARH